MALSSQPGAATLAQALAEGRAALVAESTAELYRRHPEWDARWGARGREATARDLGHNLLFLEAALRAGVPEVFTRYSAWAAGVLKSRNVPVEALVESYEVLAALVERRVGATAAAPAREVLAEAARAAVGPAVVFGERGGAEPLPGRDALLDALLKGDRRGADSILRGLLDQGFPLSRLADGLIQPVMTEVGRLWQENRITVAEEHLATAIVQTALARAFAASALPAPAGRRALFACIEGNHHALGLRLVADSFELAGWDVRYLGADVPTSDLVAHARAWRPDVLGLSLSLPQHVATTRLATDALRAALGASCPRIVVGGLPLNEFDGLAPVVGADDWFPTVAASLGAHA